MSDPMICDDCGTVVQLRQAAYGTLEVACDCDGYRTVKVNQRLPEGWSVVQ